jgi:hypothetical protein
MVPVPSVPGFNPGFTPCPRIHPPGFTPIVGLGLGFWFLRPGIFVDHIHHGTFF